MFSRQAAGETPTLPEASASEEFAQPFFILHSSFFILHSSFFILHSSFKKLSFPPAWSHPHSVRDTT